MFLGKLLPVADTIFDLRIPKVLGQVINKIPGYLGYDHNFCVTKGSAQENTFVARAVHPPSGKLALAFFSEVYLMNLPLNFIYSISYFREKFGNLQQSTWCSILHVKPYSRKS